MKSKYEIMNLHMGYIKDNLVSFYRKLDEAVMFAKLGAKDDFMSSLSIDFFQSIKKLAHLGYENFLDIEGINDATVRKNFLFSIVGYDEFQKSYAQVTNKYLKLMIVSMILENEGFTENYIAKVYGKHILSNKENDYIDYLSTRELSESNISLLNVIKLDNFDISRLSQEQRERINGYHSNYMNTSIFTDSFIDDNEKRVIKHAKVHAGATFAQVLIKKFK